MKTHEMKKKLKELEVKVTVTSHGHGYFLARVLLSDPKATFDRTWLILDAQANDLRHTTNANARDEHSGNNCFRSFYSGDVGYFYGVSADCRARFDLHGADHDDPERARVFFALIRKVIEAKNLGYVYPKCALSRVIAALEALGCPVVDVTVNGRDFASWLRERKETAPEVEPKAIAETL